MTKEDLPISTAGMVNGSAEIFFSGSQLHSPGGHDRKRFHSPGGRSEPLQWLVKAVSAHGQSVIPI